eukprot:GILI01000845.1.p1 GENE.GILI01000845.1~~GILI01000845.1.p1  ORF type:complete len:198 (-),score=56.11 GILI01000845.1:196-789(-)
MRILNIAVAGSLALAFILVIVATAIPFATYSKDDNKFSYSMWETKSEFEGTTTTTKIDSIDCSPVKTRLQAAAAFSIICIFISLAAIATVALHTLQKEIAGFKFTPMTAVIPSYICGGICCFVWILQANVFNTKFNSDGCGKTAMKDDPYFPMKLAGSFGLFVFLSLAYPALGIVYWFFARKEAGAAGGAGYSGLTA